MSNQTKKAERILSKHLWFVSDTFMGDSVVLEPRIPKSRAKQAGENATVKRVCVSNRIQDCIRLLPPFDFSEKKYVYRVDGKAEGVNVDLPMKMVPDWDYQVKNEVWLLKPNKFRYVGMVESMQSSASLTWLEVADHTLPLVTYSDFFSDNLARSERVFVHLALEAGRTPQSGNNSCAAFTDATLKAYELTKVNFLGTPKWLRAIGAERELRAWSSATVAA